MLYTLFKWLFKITGGVFFRSVTILNKERIPQKGPMLIVANHPSTFMDPIVIATLFDHTFYFLAKGILFRSRPAKWLLPKFNMIPVYRKQDDPAEMSKNTETFETCYSYLELGAVILIFPEGISITERKLRPVKTGAARIALGAEARNDFGLNMQIVSIGLNYKNPHKFNRDLIIHIAEPIAVSAYKNIYAQDPKEAVIQLTEEIRQQLESSVVIIDDENTDELVKKIEYLYTYKISKEMGITENDKAAAFELTKNMAAAVHYFVEHDPERADKMDARMSNYLSGIKKLGLRDPDIGAYGSKGNILSGGLAAIAWIVLGFPVYLYGLINNFLPFKIPGWLAKAATDKIQFRGAIMMVSGMFIFLIFYALQIILVWKYFHSVFITCMYFISLPLSGLFCYRYYYTVGKIRSKWLLMAAFYSKRRLIAELITEREQIISELDRAKEDLRLIRSKSPVE